MQTLIQNARQFYMPPSNIKKLNSSQETLTVLVRSRTKDYYNGTASVVSSSNKKGPFDILPKHAHFISLIHDGLTIHKTGGAEEHISFSNAILKAKDNIVEVYIGLQKE
jgi:F0F1-type ATP synthase epsilon subunit